MESVTRCGSSASTLRPSRTLKSHLNRFKLQSNACAWGSEATKRFFEFATIRRLPKTSSYWIGRPRELKPISFVCSSSPVLLILGQGPPVRSLEARGTIMNRTKGLQSPCGSASTLFGGAALQVHKCPHLQVGLEVYGWLHLLNLYCCFMCLFLNDSRRVLRLLIESVQYLRVSSFTCCGS